MKDLSLKDRAYNMIKEKIVNCEYPPSSFLVESELIDQVGASRTPIREALNKLEQENLVRIVPKRGVLVCEITMSTVSDIFEVRMLIEPYVIRNYALKIKKEILEQERDRICQSDSLYTSTAGYILDNDLHQLLINASENAYLIDTMNQIFVQNHRLRILSGKKIKSRNDLTKLEHIAIFDCLLAGDLESAEKAMRVHLTNSRQAAVGAMSSGNSQPRSSQYWITQTKNRALENEAAKKDTNGY